MDDERCLFCRHFVYHQEDDAGECRRYPPQWVVDEDGTVCMFAIIAEDQVCGEFKRKVM